MENFENTNEINPQLQEGALQLHIYHIKGKTIEENPFNAATNDKQLTRFHSVRVQFNKSLVTTEIALKMYVCMLHLESVSERRFSCTCNFAKKQPLNNQDQVIMPF